MALTSSSTLADALAQYNDNLYWEDSESSAKLALEAIRWLFANRPRVASQAGNTVNFEELKSEKNEIKDFLSSDTDNQSMFTRGIATDR
jgi:hypothetical protein